MSRRKMKAGSTSQVLPLFIQDTSSTTGAGLGSLVYNTASLAAKYRRQGDSAWTTITLVTATAGTWTSGGFVADGGSVTGGYEIGLPNAMLAAGATWAQLQIYGATNMLAVVVEFELDAIDYQDGTFAAVADGVLSRNVSNVEATAGEHTLCTVVLGTLENAVSGTTLTIKRTDGSTTHVTKTLSTDAAAIPIIGVQ